MDRIGIHKAAWAGVHGRDENEVGRKGQRSAGAADGDDPVFQGLVQSFQVAAAQFGKLVQQQPTDRTHICKPLELVRRSACDGRSDGYVSELMKPTADAEVVAWVGEQPISALFVSTITRAEIELSIALLPDGQRKHAVAKAAQDFFGEFSDRCLVFGEMSAIRFGQLVANRTKIGRPISTEDAQIASIALVHGLRLATRNTKDFLDIPSLTVINPWQVHNDPDQ